MGSDLVTILVAAGGLLLAGIVAVSKIFGAGKKAGGAEKDAAAQDAARDREKLRHEVDDDARVADAARELRDGWKRRE